MTGFERVEAKHQQPSAPTLRITATSQAAYLSAGAVRQYFEGVVEVEYHVDSDRLLLAIVPHNGDGANAYALGRKHGGGANVYARKPLGQLDVDTDDLDEAHVCPVFEDDDSGFVVADVSSVVEDATDDVHCPECGERYAEQGLKTHLNRTHGEADYIGTLEEMDPDEIGEPIPEGDGGRREQYATNGGSADGR